MIEKLKTEQMKSKGGSYYVLFIGLSYTGGILLVPLMEHFTVSISLWIHIALLIFAVILVIILYLIISHYRKRKLYNILELDELPQSKCRFRPSSVGHFINVLFSYVFLLGASVFMFVGYFATENIMMLAISSLVLFSSFTVNRKVVREADGLMKIKIEKNI